MVHIDATHGKYLAIDHPILPVVPIEQIGRKKRFPMVRELYSTVGNPNSLKYMNAALIRSSEMGTSWKFEEESMMMYTRTPSSIFRASAFQTGAVEICSTPRKVEIRI